MRYALPIVGARFRPPSVGLLEVMPLGFPLLLAREPSNAYDANAVRVLIPGLAEFDTLPVEAVVEKCAGFGKEVIAVRDAMPWHLGYIPREVAEEVARVMDAAGVHEVRGTLTFNLCAQAWVVFSLRG
jgi:hypothetical protein